MLLVLTVRTDRDPAMMGDSKLYPALVIDTG